MSSGSYFPPPVYLEPILEAVFHPDSYGYRPVKSAIDAVRQARQRCWRYAWHHYNVSQSDRGHTRRMGVQVREIHQCTSQPQF
jgi:hypothetical protein